MNNFFVKNLFLKLDAYLIFYTAPMVFILGLVLLWGVNVPYWDDWSLIQLFESMRAHDLNLNFLFSQHNEHRMFFPNLIFLSLAYISNWNLKVQMLINFLLALLNFILILKISNITTTLYKIQISSVTKAFIKILFSLLVFSVVQWENWLWGFQIAWFLILTCLLLSVYILLLPQIDILTKIIGSAILCFVASFSSAHGLLTWIALFPLLIAVCNSLKGQLKTIIIVWFLLFTSTTLIYFNSYHKPSHHPELSFFLHKPLVFINYIILIFGSPFPSNPILFGSITIITSVAIFIKYSIELLKYVSKLQESELLLPLSPWVSISLFSAAFALLTSLGRSGFEVLDQALSSRYTSIITLSYISNIYIAYLFLLRGLESKVSRLRSFRFGVLLGVALSLYISSTYNSSQKALVAAHNSYQSRYRSKICLEFARYIDPDSNNLDCIKSLYPDPDFIISSIEILENLHFINFIKDSNFLEYNSSQSTNEAIYGFIDSPQVNNEIILNENNSLIKFQGWARVSSLYQNTTYPNTVFFSVNDSLNFFATTHTYLERKDVADSLGSDEYLFSGWSIDLDVQNFSQGNNKVTAWIYNRLENSFVPLNNQPIVKIESIR